MQFRLFFIFFFLINLNLVYSSSYISEISFVGDEYVEIYSDSFLNLSNTVVIDESLKNNSLELLRYINNSDYYLIVGNNFVKNYENIDLLNCTIYKTDKSQVSNGGLKSSGESFSIGNLSFNLSDKDYSFENFESLNLINNSWIKSSKSICDVNLMLNTSLELLPDEKLNENTSCGNYNLDIIVKDDIFEDKLEFKFSTNYSSGNYFLNYWIEDFKGNVVKNLRNTTSLNWKYYTPKGSTQILKIFGELKYSNCTINSEKYVYYYSNYVKTNTIVKTQKSKVSSDEDLVKESYVKLLNINSLVNGSESYLSYEIYRGDSRKSVVNFYLNSKIILKQKLDLYENLSGRLYIDNSDFEYDYLKVIGLDVDKKYNFTNYQKNNNSIIYIDQSNNSYVDILDTQKSLNILKSVKFLNLTKKVNQFYEIKDFKSDFGNVYFNINSNINNLDSHCYISKVRTKVSDVVNVSTGEVTIKLNVNKLSNFENLKLYCKYKKYGLKSYNYKSHEFNFSKDYVPKLMNSSISNYNKLSGKIIKDEINIDKKELSIFTLNSGDVVYEDKNINFINTSIYFVFIGVLLFMIPLILFW